MSDLLAQRWKPPPTPPAGDSQQPGADVFSVAPSEFSLRKESVFHGRSVAVKALGIPLINASLPSAQPLSCLAFLSSSEFLAVDAMVTR